MVGSRRKARTVALQALYEIDTARHKPEDVLTWLREEESLAEKTATFARELVYGVLENKDTIDSTISACAPEWPVEQISIVDRNILRIAILEILLRDSVPLKAAINEAVELAKTFGSDSSPKFINGALRTVSAKANR